MSWNGLSMGWNGWLRGVRTQVNDDSCKQNLAHMARNLGGDPVWVCLPSSPHAFLPMGLLTQCPYTAQFNTEWSRLETALQATAPGSPLASARAGVGLMSPRATAVSVLRNFGRAPSMTPSSAERSPLKRKADAFSAMPVPVPVTQKRLAGSTDRRTENSSPNVGWHCREGASPKVRLYRGFYSLCGFMVGWCGKYSGVC